MHNPYRTPDAPVASRDGAVAPRKSGLLVGLPMSLLTALVISLSAPQFGNVFASFGSQVPWITGLVLRFHWLAWLLPAGVLAVSFFWPDVGRRRVIVLAIGLLSLLVVLPLSLLALYFPIFELAQTI